MPNLTKRNALFHTERIVGQLHRFGMEVSMDCRYRMDFPESGVQFCEDFYQGLAACDIVVAVGGDGTIIHAAKHAAMAGKPVLGINVGRLGFVAGLEADELEKLEGLVTGKYAVEKPDAFAGGYCVRRCASDVLRIERRGDLPAGRSPESSILGAIQQCKYVRLPGGWPDFFHADRVHRLLAFRRSNT